MKTLRDKAVDAAKRGFSVFRLRPNTKDPYAGSDHHEGHKEGREGVVKGRCAPKTNLWDVYEEWTDANGDPLNCNIGIDTTHGLVVLDIDCKNGATGEADLKQWEAKLGPLPVGYQVRTPSGGLHMPFRTRTNKRIGGKKVLGKGIDIRGHHGYVLAEGSIYSCKEYVGINTDIEVPFMPEAWEAHLEEAGERAKSQTPLGEWDVPENIESAVERVLALPEPSHGDRNDNTFKAVAVVKDWQISEGLCFELLSEHYPTGLSAEETKKTIRSCYKGNSRNQPGVATPEYHFGAEIAAFEKLSLPVPASKMDVTTGVKLYAARCVADIKLREIEWLWSNRIPRVMTSIVGGMPGLGKSQFMFALAAAITTGGTMPDGSQAKIGNVVLVNAEDHPEMTLVPRLMAAGADLTRVHLLEGVYEADKPREKRQFSVKQMPALKQLIRDVGNVALVIIDPIMSYLGGGKNSDKDDEVRAALFDLNRMAEDENFAVVLVTHLNKGSGGHVLDRFMGSRAFTGLPRSAWLITSDPDDATEQRCIFSLAKTNVGPKDVPGIAYSVTTVTLPDGIQAQKLTFESEPEHRRAKELLNPQQSPEQKSAVDEACEFLKVALRDGPKASKQLSKEAKEARISEDSLKKARKKLGAKSTKGDGPDAPWVLALPPHISGTNADEEFADLVDWQPDSGHPLQ